MNSNSAFYIITLVSFLIPRPSVLNVFTSCTAIKGIKIQMPAGRQMEDSRPKDVAIVAVSGHDPFFFLTRGRTSAQQACSHLVVIEGRR